MRGLLPAHGPGVGVRVREKARQVAGRARLDRPGLRHRAVRGAARDVRHRRGRYAVRIDFFVFLKFTA